MAKRKPTKEYWILLVESGEEFGPYDTQEERRQGRVGWQRFYSRARREGITKLRPTFEDIEKPITHEATHDGTI